MQLEIMVVPSVVFYSGRRASEIALYKTAVISTGLPPDRKRGWRVGRGGGSRGRGYRARSAGKTIGGADSCLLLFAYVTTSILPPRGNRQLELRLLELKYP